MSYSAAAIETSRLIDDLTTAMIPTGHTPGPIDPVYDADEWLPTGVRMDVGTLDTILFVLNLGLADLGLPAEVIECVHGLTLKLDTFAALVACVEAAVRS